MTALPKEMHYAAVPNAAPARMVKLNALPVNAQTFSSGSLCRIQCPRRPGAFLIPSMCHLTFDVVVDSTLVSSGSAAIPSGTTTTAGVMLDGHASACISQMQLFHNSTQVEIVQAYNKLYGKYLEVQVPREQKSGEGAWSICGGANDSRVATTDPTFNSNEIMQTGTSTRFVMPLISSVFGAGQNGNKYIPLDRLNSDIVIEFTFDDFRNAFRFYGQGSTAGGSYVAANTWYNVGPTNALSAIGHITIQNVNLTCGLVELDSASLSMYNSMHPGEVELATTQYRTYQSSLMYPLSSASVLVPARFQSVNQFIWGLWNNANINDMTKGSVTWTERGNLDTFAYRIGSLVFPPRPIKASGTGAEAFAELEKSLRGISAVGMTSVAFTKDEYVLDSGAGAFVAAQELSVFPWAQGVSYSGASTIGQNAFVDLTFGSGGMVNATYNMYVWAAYDCKLIIDEAGNMKPVF